MGKDYYEILGISSEINKTDSSSKAAGSMRFNSDLIANSFRKLAIKYHPLRDDNDVANKSYMFSQICEAYDVLSSNTEGILIKTY